MLMSETLLLASFLLVVYAILYGFVYPKFVQNKAQRLLLFDVLASLALVILVGQAYWNSGVRFSFGLFAVNWFWALLILAMLIEPVFMMFYERGWKVFPKMREKQDKNP